MKTSSITRKLALRRLNPMMVKELTNEEMETLMYDLLKEYTALAKAIQGKTYEGKQGRDGKTPIPDVDYISTPRMERMFAKEIDRVSREIQRTVRDGKDGKDAVITEQHIQDVLKRLAPHTKRVMDNVEACRRTTDKVSEDVQKQLEEIDKRVRSALDVSSRAHSTAVGGATRQFVIDYVAQNGGGGSGGSGDMEKSVYDTDDDGIVEQADTITNQGALATLDEVTDTEINSAKLNGIEAGADVTDATNVEAAGGIMDGDFSANGLMKRTGAGTYAVATAGDADALVSDASTTVKGKVELATTAETNTGTSTTLAVTPDGLAGSNLGTKTATVALNGTTALTTDDKYYFRIPAELNGMNLVAVSASVGTGASGASSSGTPTFTIKNVTDNQQMLSTNLTVDANEYTSATAATPAVINTSYDDVATDDLIEVACTVAGTGVTYASVRLSFRLP